MSEYVCNTIRASYECTSFSSTSSISIHHIFMHIVLYCPKKRAPKEKKSKSYTCVRVDLAKFMFISFGIGKEREIEERLKTDPIKILYQI